MYELSDVNNMKMHQEFTEIMVMKNGNAIFRKHFWTWISRPIFVFIGNIKSIQQTRLESGLQMFRQERRREFGNFAKTQGVLFAQVLYSRF